MWRPETSGIWGTFKLKSGALWGLSVPPGFGRNRMGVFWITVMDLGRTWVSQSLSRSDLLSSAGWRVGVDCSSGVCKLCFTCRRGLASAFQSPEAK